MLVVPLRGIGSDKICTMPVPDVLPIRHEPDYRTDQIGRHAEGQFLGGIVGAYLGGWQPGQTRDDFRWYAYLHQFDDNGIYLWSGIAFAGVNVEGTAAVDRAQAMLAEWLGQLDDVVYAGIGVRLFQTEYDGILFGLVDESAEDRGDHVELYPGPVGFSRSLGRHLRHLRHSPAPLPGTVGTTCGQRQKSKPGVPARREQGGGVGHALTAA